MMAIIQTSLSRVLNLASEVSGCCEKRWLKRSSIECRNNCNHTSFAFTWACDWLCSLIGKWLVLRRLIENRFMVVLSQWQDHTHFYDWQTATPSMWYEQLKVEFNVGIIVKASILDKINGPSGPTLPPISMMPKWRAFAPLRLHHCFEGEGG